MMKKLKYLIIALVIGLSFVMPQAHAIKIKVLGKGGVVIYPDGSRKICPQFCFKVCYEMEVTLDDIIDILFSFNNPGSGPTVSGDINAYLPVNATLYIYEETGVVTRQAQIIWINPACQSNTEAGEITLPSSAVGVNLL